MAAPTNHWKLGLFVLIGAVMVITSAAVFGTLRLNKETGRYVSYFDESVQGLEAGSPIKFRGVTIGTVGKIDVAPDHRHVEVTSELGKDVLSRLGLDVTAGLAVRGAPKKLVQAIDLRAQLVSSGLTGVKFLQLDFFTVADNPSPKLPFPVPKNYIPATSSMMKDLEQSLVRTMNSLPKITEQVTGILSRIDKLVGKAGEGKLIEEAISTLAATRRFVEETRRKIAPLNTAQLSEQLEKTLADFSVTAVRVSNILTRIDGDKGLLNSVERASTAFGDTAHTVNGLGGQIEDTLQAIEEAAKSMNKLTGALEKEPDMLVKGREKQQ